jgi:signal transduction histidine kinase
VPLLHEGQVVGTLELIDRRSSGLTGTAFTDSDERLLGILAQAAVDAWERADAYAEMEAMALTFKRRNHELTLLHRISREIQGSVEIDDILQVILTGVTSGKGLGYNRAAVFLVREEEEALVGVYGIGATIDEVGRVWKDAVERFRTLEDHFEAADDIDPDLSFFHRLIRSLRLSLLDRGSYFSRVIAERRWFNVRDAADLLGQDRRVAETIRTAAFAIVPIWTKDLVIGAILVDNCYNRRPIRDEDLVLLQTIANQCGMALDAAGMIEQLSAAMRKLEEMTGRVVAAERLAAVGEVAAGVAHDIRNPLTAIGGFTRRLAKRLPPSDIGQRYVEIIEHEVVRLEKLAGDVLELAIVREKRTARLDLVEMVRQWQTTNEARLAARGVSMLVESSPLTVEADPMLAEQAVFNILDNAIESIAGPGGEIRCLGERRATEIRLRIEDTGCGMTPAETARIFDAFYTSKTEGTGLGLALARKAIRTHGGEIEAVSSPGRGTIMTIVLPRLVASG